MKSNKEYDPKLAFGLLLQGPPKSGKTFISMMFPNPYIADLDNNLSGAHRRMKEHYPEKEYRYDTICVRDEGDPRPKHEQWPLMLKLLNAALADPWVKTIVIDSAAAVADALQAYIVSQKGSNKKDGMTISDWIPFRNLLVKLVTDLRATGRLLVMTSHEEYTKDEGTGTVIARTNIPSKLADNFGGFFSDCWRTEIDEYAGKPKYVVRVLPTKLHPHIGNSFGMSEATYAMDVDLFVEKYLNK